MRGAGVLAPVATHLFAVNDTNKQQELFLKGSRFCAYFVLFVTGGMVFLGESTIRLWVGDRGDAATYLAILSLGAVLPLCGNVSDSILLGRAKLRALTIVVVCDTICVISVILLLGTWF